MAQSFIAGGTNYSEQSINDIRVDIEEWIALCKQIKSLFETTILDLKEQKYWENKIATDFKVFCYSVPKICNTFCSDFEIVLESIKNDKITSREITLMRNIHKVSVENEEYSWKSFRSNDERWHDYGNSLFEKVETLYCQGRDFFVTLRDVSNAVSRMEDYMIEEKTVIDNSTYTDNSINIGDGNKLKNNNFGNINTAEIPQKKSSIWGKFFLPIIVAVVSGLIVTALCIWLGLK